MLFIKKTTYSLELSYDASCKIHTKIGEAYKIMQDTLLYDLDQKQSLVVLFSLFINITLKGSN